MKSNTLSWSDSDSFKKIVLCLQNNKVILAPSDTVWGLCGAPTQEVFDALNKLKVRNDKPYLLLTRSLEDIEQYAQISENEDFRKMINALWPGPLTIIFKAKEIAPAYMVSKDGKIAFRIPCHEKLQTLLEKVPVLFSTSANISGNLVPVTYADVSPRIKEQVAAIVLPEKEDEQQSIVPSTIVDVSGGVVKVVREGAIPAQVIQLFFKK